MTFILARRPVFLFCVLLVLASCASGTRGASGQTPQSGTPAAQPNTVLSIPAGPSNPDLALWIAAFKQEATARGVSEPVFDRAFANVSVPLSTVIKSDHTQPEHTKLFNEYIKGFITEKKLASADEQWQSHAQLLAQVQDTYGVPIPIMLALWQTESRFGENQGSVPVIQSLFTLAYDGRRSAFFREQLIDALLIVQQEHIDPEALTGSWAGAMGQVQFMPSSYLAFAVDFDGDGKRDIWTDDADAAASMANYLHTRGWDPAIGWGMHVRVPAGADAAEWAASKEKHTNAQWRRLGIRKADGKRLPHSLYETRLIMPDDDPANAYLVTSNYDVIMDWNRSVYFATAVNLLADAIAQRH